MEEHRLSQRARRINPSATLSITAKAKQAKAAGEDVLLFSAGEPDYPSPEEAKQAVVKALQDNFTYYTPASGIPELKAAICAKLKRDNNLEYSPEQICVGAGGKQVLDDIFQVLVDPKDEVIIPTPYWVSYDEQVKLAQGKSVFCKLEEIEDKITDKTKIIILNSPSNPTGKIISEQRLKELASAAVKHQIYIISDEVYEFFVFSKDKKHVSIASLNSEIYRLTLTVNAPSKTYAMTGWRIGYAAGPKEIIKAMDNLQSHTTSNPCSFAQKGAVAALLGPQERVFEMVKEFKERGEYLAEELNKLPYFECDKPEGAFYIFAKIPGRKSVEFCEQLLAKAKIALVPGIAFGQDYDEYVRISFSSSRQDIDKALQRLKEIVL